MRMKPPGGTPTNPANHRRFYGDVVGSQAWREAALRWLQSHRKCDRCGGRSAYVIGTLGDLSALCVRCFEFSARERVHGGGWVESLQS